MIIEKMELLTPNEMSVRELIILLEQFDSGSVIDFRDYNNNRCELSMIRRGSAELGSLSLTELYFNKK
jgi:hypothetical protein